MKLNRSIDTTSQHGMKIDLTVDDTEVARLWAPTYQMRIGSAVIKIGGLAGVGTNEECRGQGYARHIVEGSTLYFAETGHDLALLFGIPDFYHKFGYIPVLPAVHLYLSLQDIEAAQLAAPVDDVSMRLMQTEDFPGVIETYNKQNGNRTGSFLRPVDTWSGFRRGTQWGCAPLSQVVLNAEQQIIGYFVVDDVPGECRIAEVGFTTRADFRLILAAIAEEARKRGSDEIKAYLPPDHPFALFCRGYCGCRLDVTYFRSSDGMARIINIRSLFEKLKDELMQRLAGSTLSSTSGVLQIESDVGSVALDITNGEVAITETQNHTWNVVMPQQQLVQLVMGYRSVGEVATDNGVNFDAVCISLLDTLFPAGVPWLPTPDWF